MRVTYLGHASLLVETSNLTILTDPTLGDVALDGIAQFCPRRALDPEALPPIDILYISHIHTDHFEVASLAKLRDSVETVVCANDPFILEGLEALGFESVQPIKDGQALRIDDTRLLVTPSRFKVPEHGLLISDSTGRVWNQVDTLCEPEWLPNLRADGPIDVHFANFSPLSWYHVLVNGVSSFPYSVYQEQFDVIRAARAKLVVPGSSGLSFRAPYTHMNRYWFPIRHERFAKDISGVLDCKTAVMHPGDAVVIEDGQQRVLRQAAGALVRTTDPSTDEIDFNPTAPLPALEDDNPLGIASADIATAVREVLAKIDAAMREPRKQIAIEKMRAWGVRMLITVRFPDRTAHWSIDFTARTPTVREGTIEHPNYFFEANASGLHDVERGLCWDRFFYFGYRAFHTVYAVREEGVFAPTLPDQGRLGAGSIPLPHELVFSLWEPTPRAWILRGVRESTRD
ncbi:MAG TPA: MBL fold metallo-hydrolase [Kofleriaceae bacterium]|nr:MBL fold metallo-hydrolase [Kofleriaceae bacterium]